MKPKFRHIRSLAIASSVMLCMSSAQAQSTLYWDANGTTAGAGTTPTGTWGTDNFWNTDSAGGAGTFSTATTSTSNVFFSAGTDAVNPYTVGLGAGTREARLVTFEDGTATLNDGTLSLGNQGGITVTANTVTGATISSGLTISGAQTFNVAASRILTLATGTFTRNAGATLNVANTGTVTTTMTGLDSASLVNGIIGPWASFGSGASTRYATIDGSNNIVGLTGTAAATAAGVTSATGTVNYDVAAVGTLGGGANINTLRYTGASGTIAGALTTKGIMNVGGGTLTLSGTMTGSGELVVNTANGDISFSAAHATGTYGLVKTGSGRLTTSNSDTTFSGTVTVNGGVLQYGDNLSRLTTGNITLNGGVIEQRWTATNTLAQGSGAGQIRIIGGESGFSENGATGLTWNIGNVTWGSSTFNPSKFLLQTSASQSGSNITFSSAINLNGANRTILANAGAAGNAASTLSGVISNSTGTAGLVKEGAGLLTLSNAANSYNGATTITAGTLAVSTLANGGSNSGIGSSSAAAANLLLGDGTTFRYTGGAVSTNRGFTINGTAAGHGASLDASGSGAVNFTATGSPAYGTADQTRSLTLTGTNTGNNILAANIADNGTGAVSLNKTGAGLWVLSGTNSYTGPTTISAGTLSVGASGNLGAAASNLVFNGGTLQVTNTTNLPNFSTIGHTVSFTSRQTVGLDISSGTFTADQVLNQGAGGLSKAGAGTLVLNQANTYGGVTTISAGTLRLDSGGSLATLGVINNSIYLINQNATTGTAPLANIIGSGSIAAGPSATLTINSDTGLSSNALNTTGGGSFALSGVTTPTFGGLVGTTGNLSSSFSSGYSGVTHLTLDTKGNSFTYGGVINDGAAGMDLTKKGAGTQTLTGTNTYTGDTLLNNGTVSLSGTAGALTGTAGITFNGGGLTLTSADTTAEDDFDRVNDSAPITSNGGTITYTTTTAASTKAFIETLGSVALTSGQLNLVNTLDKTAGSQTLALSGLTRTGATNSSVITFSNAGGLNLTNDRIRVNGITADTAAGQIIGAWATVGTAANSQTDYAVYDSDGANGFVVARNVAGSAETTWTTAANAYTTSAGGTVTLTGTRTITALRNTGASTVLTLASGNNLQTYGALNGAATLLTIAPGTGGVLTTPTGGGSLYLTANGVNTDTQGAHTGISVTAPINNNGSDAVTLVKSGVGVLQLNATSNYSGGTVLNSGILWAQTDASLGEVNGDITFGGSATLVLAPNNGTSAYTYTLPATRSIIVNDGAMATIAGGRAGAGITINGDISGAGGVTTGRVALLSSGGVGTSYNFSLLGNNTFTGEFGVGNGGEGSAGGGLAGVTINSLADSTSPITLNYGSSAFLSLGSSATANLSVPNRPVNLLNSNITIRNQDANNTMTFGSVSTTTAGAKTLNLGDGGAGGIIAGNITDGAGTIGIIKTAGTWVLSGINTYSGQTQFNGSGVGLTLVGSQAASPNTTFLMNTSASTASSTIRFLDNTGGVNDSTATFGGTYRLQSNNTPGITNNFFVGNDSTANGGTGSGTTTGSTMIIGTMDWNTVANGTTNVGNIAIQGGNGYRLQINNVVMFNGSGHTAGNTNNTNFIPTTANVTLGNVTMAAGNAVNGVIPFLVLDGTSSDNRITGTISNASDVGTSLRPVNVTKSNTSTWTLSGANTYTGVTTVSGGTLVAAVLADGGVASSIGASSSAANQLLLGNNTTLRYAGSGHSSDRSFTLNVSTAGHGATLDASGTGALNLTNTATPGYGTTAQTRILTLTGNNTGANTLAANLTNNGGSAVGITKSSTGRWVLTGTNSYTGTTTISGGVLQAIQGTGVATNSGISLDGGVFQSSGTFTRSVGAVAAGSTNYNMTANGGGFSAIGGKFTVTLDNTASVRNWGSTVSTSPLVGTLKFGSSSSNAEVEMTNNINFNGTNRTIEVTAGVGGDFATMSGALSNSTGTAGLTKSGTGKLILANTNTYNGATSVNAGTLLVNGSTNATSTVAVSVGATLGGTGTIAGTVNVSGVLSPGASIESLATGALTMASGSTFVYEVANDTPTGADMLGVNGALSLTNVNLSFDLATIAALSLPDTTWTVGDKLTLISYTGTGITSGFAGYTDDNTYNFGDNVWTFNYNDTVAGGNYGADAIIAGQTNFVTLTALTVIPEPSSVALLGTLGAMMLLRRRR